MKNAIEARKKLLDDGPYRAQAQILEFPESEENEKIIEVELTNDQLITVAHIGEKTLYDKIDLESIDVSEAENGDIPLLMNHDMLNFNGIVGNIVPNTVRIEGGRMTAKFKMMEGFPEVDAAYSRVKQGARNVSVTLLHPKYEILEDEDSVTFVLKNSRLAEASLVTVGANTSAKVVSYNQSFLDSLGRHEMSEENTATEVAEEVEVKQAAEVVDNGPSEEEIRDKAVKDFAGRIDEAAQFAADFKDELPGIVERAKQWVVEGEAYSAITRKVGAEMNARRAKIAKGEIQLPKPTIGMEKNDHASFSMVAVLMHQADKSDSHWEKEAAASVEMIDAAKQAARKMSPDFRFSGNLIPADVWEFAPITTDTKVARRLAKMDVAERRYAALDVNDSTNTGDQLVGLEYMEGMFVDYRDQRSAFLRSGMTQVPVNSKNASIPRQTSDPVVGWTETKQFTADLAESTVAFDTIEMTLKQQKAYMAMTPAFAEQALPMAEGIFRRSLARASAKNIDQTIANGRVHVDGANSGTIIASSENIPLGIAGRITSNADVEVNDRVLEYNLGANGGALSDAHLAEMEQLLGENDPDAPGSAVAFMNWAIRKKLLTTALTSGGVSDVRLWDPSSMPRPVFPAFPAEVTGNLPKTLHRGTRDGSNITDKAATSQLIIAVPSELYYANWGGGMSFLVDPYSGALRNVIRFHVNSFWDFAIGYPKAVLYAPGVVTV